MKGDIIGIRMKALTAQGRLALQQALKEEDKMPSLKRLVWERFRRREIINPSEVVYYKNPLPLKVEEKLKRKLKGYKMVGDVSEFAEPFHDVMRQNRAGKDDYEIEVIRDE